MFLQYQSFPAQKKLRKQLKKHLTFSLLSY